MTVTYLSLGSNLGDRLSLLASATRLLETGHTHVTQVSSVYETRPLGKTDQPNFLNIAVAVETTLEPAALLNHTQTVENELGRERHERWGPRTVDIDILLYDHLVIDDLDLTLPHPRLKERAFALIPLLELNPALPFEKDLAALPDQGVVCFLVASAFMKAVRGVK